MPRKGLFSVSAFAKLSRVTPATLHYYDRIGLLSPGLRSDNSYRYYSHEQLSIINLIRMLQTLGMPLDAIKSLKNGRTPEMVREVLQKQVKDIDNRIEELLSARELSLTLQKCILSCLNIDETMVTVQNLPAAAIIRGDLNDYSRGRNPYDALLSFYQDIAAKYPGVNLNYPVWAIFSEERIKQGDWNWPERYYFYNPAGYDRRPAGLYAVSYARGGYGSNLIAHKKCMEHIEKNKLEICGDAYEEYPLNEFCVTDSKNYLVRLLIPLCEKKAVHPSPFPPLQRDEVV